MDPPERIMFCPDTTGRLPPHPANDSKVPKVTPDGTGSVKLTPFIVFVASVLVILILIVNGSPTLTGLAENNFSTLGAAKSTILKKSGGEATVAASLVTSNVGFSCRTPGVLIDPSTISWYSQVVSLGTTPPLTTRFPPDKVAPVHSTGDTDKVLTLTPAGIMSVKATFSKSMLLSFLTVTVRVVVPLVERTFTPNAFVTVGGAKTNTETGAAVAVCSLEVKSKVGFSFNPEVSPRMVAV
jgi:hypothetical protein